MVPANAKMITPVRDGWEKNVVQSPEPQITSARSGSVPPIPNARFLMVCFTGKCMEHRVGSEESMKVAAMSVEALIENPTCSIEEKAASRSGTKFGAKGKFDAKK